MRERQDRRIDIATNLLVVDVCILVNLFGGFSLGVRLTHVFIALYAGVTCLFAVRDHGRLVEEDD